jgi:hypothetical protein
VSAPNISERHEPHIPKPNFAFRLNKNEFDFDDLQNVLEFAITVIREERARIAASLRFQYKDIEHNEQSKSVWPDAA